MRKLLPFLILVAAVSAFGQKKTLLAIFPHSDDETVVSEVLVKYSELGYRVQLIIATDGRYGTRVTKIPAGEELARLRKEESLCAAKKLGIDEPIFLGLERLDTLIGVGKYFGEHKRLIALLKESISKLEPEIIITFGPDGDTSHSEHIVTGAAVTDVLIREGWVEKYPLYYVSWPKDLAQKADLGYVHEKYMNVKIEYSQAAEDKGLESMACYVSQFTPEEIMEDRERKLADKSNTAYFRQLVVKKGIRNRF